MGFLGSNSGKLHFFVAWTTKKCPDRALARRKGMLFSGAFLVKSVFPEISQNIYWKHISAGNILLYQNEKKRK